MERQSFEQALQLHADTLNKIRLTAHEVHAQVNQHYDHVHPYSIHLDSVAGFVKEYAHLVCDNPEDIVPILFGAWMHDSIEDARLTYNNVTHIARKFMPEESARLAAEIVYALTNEKGRTRAERANERYYEGIRNTPYAPLCKMADRLANMSYSATHAGIDNKSMKEVYRQETPHFLLALTAGSGATDPRTHVPESMIERLQSLCRD